jgi:hypothetical protein
MHGSWLQKACSRASSVRSFSPSPTHAIARNQHGTYSYFLKSWSKSHLASSFRPAWPSP